MRRFVKAIGIAVVMLLAALVIPFAWGRLRPPTAVQSEAMALLKTPPRPAGSHNAWADFWLLDHDVPAAERDAAYARERRNVTAWNQQGDRAAARYSSDLGSRYRALPQLSVEENAQLCGTKDEHCLARVQQHAPALSALLLRHAKRLARLRELGSAELLWDDMPLHVATPFPSFGRSHDLLLTAAALDFVSGHQSSALTQVCGNVDTLRRLHAHTNSLVGAMMTAAWSDPAERLFAEMLVRLPSGESVPVACTQAFAPVTLADVDLCAPMQRDYAGLVVTIEAAARQRPVGVDRVKQFVTFDASHMLRLMAPQYAWACRSDQRTVMLADRRMNPAKIPQVQGDIFDMMSNAVPTILARIAAPAYVDFANRNEDYAAGLRLGRALLQAHASASSPGEVREALAQQLAALNQRSARTYRIDADERHVRMSRFVQRPYKGDLVLQIAP